MGPKRTMLIRQEPLVVDKKMEIYEPMKSELNIPLEAERAKFTVSISV